MIQYEHQERRYPDFFMGLEHFNIIQKYVKWWYYFNYIKT